MLAKIRQAKITQAHVFLDKSGLPNKCDLKNYLVKGKTTFIPNLLLTKACRINMCYKDVL